MNLDFICPPKRPALDSLKKKCKMKKRIMVLVTIAVWFIGCTNPMANITPSEFQEIRLEDLVHQYQNRRPRVIKNELIRRKAVPLHEWQYIDQKRLVVGMSEVGLQLSWGYPRSVGSWGVHKQYIYSSDRAQSKYVHLKNGKVSSWQE